MICVLPSKIPKKLYQFVSTSLLLFLWSLAFTKGVLVDFLQTTCQNHGKIIWIKTGRNLQISHNVGLNIYLLLFFFPHMVFYDFSFLLLDCYAHLLSFLSYCDWTWAFAMWSKINNKTNGAACEWTYCTGSLAWSNSVILHKSYGTHCYIWTASCEFSCTLQTQNIHYQTIHLYH